ncbi:HD-GYP domain-containing protein [Clostridium grantii]|uniref:HDIG domain-containing protein n=1 Tax=Clostridium grantii DSM 8605 TaxID=1121316 RepID=A0A1M5RPM7_9CLOT|nr:HD domain-containing phosphohydrolase [Clostridium grantii]SHH27813.1 HDIG domain-containing protein [Clostridium grantii DSM 8605]
MKKIPIKVKKFLIILYLITFFLLGIFIKSDYLIVKIIDFKPFLFFVFLVFLTESLTVVYKDISISTSFAIMVATYVLFGGFNAIIIITIGFVFRVVKKGEKEFTHALNTPLYGTIANCCMLINPIMLGNWVYILMGEIISNSSIIWETYRILLFGIIFFLANTVLMAILVSSYSGKKFIYIFLNNLKIMLLNTIALIPFGILIAVIFETFGYLGVLLMLCPTIFARYTYSLFIQTKDQSIQLVNTLSKSLEAKDEYTEGHSQRVAEIATEIARELKYSEWKIEEIRLAALLHDIGKIGITDNILLKPGRLEDEEFDLIKTHPEIGYNILKDVKITKGIIDIVRFHHERYDGEGYPLKKSHKELSFEVFIVQLADAIDAMATDRPYRKALSEEKIIKEITFNSGKQFHPEVVKAYISVMDKRSNISTMIGNELERC